MKKNYVIRHGDIIRISEAYASDFRGNTVFTADVNANGRYTAVAMDGSKEHAFPLDTIEYIKTDGIWYEVRGTYCTMEDILRNNMHVTYDLEEVPPCISRKLNDSLGDCDY